jgi:hypothetical protein
VEGIQPLQQLLALSKRIPCLCFAVFGLVSISQLGCVASQSAPGAIASSTDSSYTLDTPIAVIAADPGGAAVLNMDLPGLLADPSYSEFKGMSLKRLASLSGGRLDQQSLAQTEADLQALPKQVAGVH